MSVAEWVTVQVERGLGVPWGRRTDKPFPVRVPRTVVVIRLPPRQPGQSLGHAWSAAMESDAELVWVAMGQYRRIGQKARLAARYVGCADPDGLVRYVWRIDGWSGHYSGRMAHPVGGELLADDPGDSVGGEEASESRTIARLLVGARMPPQPNPIRIIWGVDVQPIKRRRRSPWY
ncbi:hypothetical protein [Amycolatopsis antarctica]|nr:hypothetical protein [Amycolatopsis antarctica]